MLIWIRIILLCGVIAMAGATASAKVYSPWILSDGVADTRSVSHFAADPRWAKLSGQEKALAVWRYLTDPLTGTWHYADTSEGNDPNWESRIIKDPIKTLNVYGYAVCTIHACLIEGLYEALGFGVRQMEFGGYHRTAEVEWEGAWHYLDVDERAYLLDKEGRVVSVTDAVSRPELWAPSAQLVSPFYPQNGGINGITNLAKHGPGGAHWHWRTLGHTMDFVLRPGESLTRYWKGQGRWRVDPSWQGEQQLQWLQSPPAGPKTSSDISVNNSYGNGLWVYEPKLSNQYRDFTDGVYRTQNVMVDPKGLRVKQGDAGWAEWRVRTPYIIAGQPHDLMNQQDDTEAAIATFTATGNVTLSVSTDGGRHWKQVWTSPKADGKQRLDLTKWVAGTYEYHVRLVLRGPAWKTRVSTLRLTTWTQLAPASLPRLHDGFNKLSFTWNDRRGDTTEMFAIEPNFNDLADLKHWGLQIDGDYHADNVAARITGPITMKVTALAGIKLRWLHIGGAFNTHHGDVKKPDRILYSLDPSTGWKLLHHERPPDWVRHWYYNQEVDLDLNRPTKAVWIKLDPAVAVNGLRVYGHCAPDDAEQSGPVTVTHVYRMRGKEHTSSFTFTKPSDYEIYCVTEPENMSVKMTVPSRKK